MLKFFFLLLCFTSKCLLAQAGRTPLVLSKFLNKTVAIKCVAKDYDMLSAILDNGIEYSRIECVASIAQNQLNTLNYSTGKITKIEPAVARFKELNAAQRKDAKILAILEPFLGKKVTEKAAKNFSFGMAVIESSISKEINKVMGTILEDESVEQDKTYAYRVKIKGCADSYILISTGTNSLITPMVPISGKLENKKTVEISWDAMSLNAHYLGFIIERKKDNGAFEAIFDEPYVHVVSSSEKKGKIAFIRNDSLVQGVKYTYVISPIDYFGDRQKGSNEIVIYIPKLTNVQLYVDTIFATGTTRLGKGTIEKVDQKMEAEIEKLHILRSNKNFGTYSFLQEAKRKGMNFEFQYDLEIASGDAFYYKVLAISKDNDSTLSNAKYFFTLDQIPPTAPSKLVGKIDGKGRVFIDWSANAENDIQGYRVYRGNAKNEEFVEMTRKLEQKIEFRDSLALNNLTPEMYYFVVAVDDNFNNSVHSDTILVIKPDTIAPAPPQITDVETLKTSVRLTVRGSSSADVASYFLLRSVSNGAADTIQRFKIPGKTLIDSTAQNGSEYYYQLGCYDKSRNKAFSKVQHAVVESGVRDSLTVVVALDRTNKKIDLRWKAPNQKVDHYTVYRATDGKKLQLYKTLEAEITSFIDTEIVTGEDYRYVIRYTTTDGFTSEKHVEKLVNY
jgi:uncharacterized protein